MNEDLLREAVNLYRAGNKQEAKRILLDVADQDPDCLSAWYGLALCEETGDLRRSHLNKVLSIDPNHAKAKKMISEMDKHRNDPTKSQEEPQAQPSAEKSRTHRAQFSARWVSYPIFILLVLFVGWLYWRVDQLEKQMDYVTPLAENANRYAHSHYYSDQRLKTNVLEIEDPVAKVMQLRGVYYDWSAEAQSQMGLDNSRQVGVIAQEVESVFPELVTTDPNGIKQVDYERLTAVLIEAIKQQQREIEQLQK